MIMESTASRSASHHRGLVSGARSLRPAVNSETITAISLRRSSTPASIDGTDGQQPRRVGTEQDSHADVQHGGRQRRACDERTGERHRDEEGAASR